METAVIPRAPMQLDHACILAAQAGDPQAFNRLVRCCRATVMRTAACYCRNRDEVPDVAQEAFVEVYIHLHQLHHPAAFAGWLRQIVFRRCTRRLRRGVLPTVPLDEALALPSRDLGPERSLIESEFRALLHHGVSRLPALERETLDLYLTGISYAQIADQLGVPVSTVKKRLFRARRRLDHLKGHHD